MLLRSAAVALAALPVLIVPVLAQAPNASGSPAATAALPVVTCPAVAPGRAPASAGVDLPVAKVRAAPPAAPVGTWAGSWEPLPAAPIAGRTGAATDLAIWTDRMYVWGGRGADGALLTDGAWYDVAAGRWEPLPDAGLAPRERFGFAADLQGITIWGGVDAAGHPLADGARFGDMRREPAWRWVPLPPAPLTPGPASIAGDVNATFVITPGAAPGDPPRWAVLDWTPDEADEGETQVLAWDDPSDPDLRMHGRFTTPPLPAGTAYEIASNGRDILALAHGPDDTAIASWLTEIWPGTWSEPERVPLPASGSCAAAGTTALGWLRIAADGAPVGLLVERGGRHRWRSMAAPPFPVEVAGSLVWAPAHLVAADALVAWSLADQAWLALPPLPDGPRTGVSAAWSHGRLLVWGGRAADGSLPATGWIFTPDVPAGTIKLPGGHDPRFADCGGVGTSAVWHLRGAPDDPMLVWFQHGRTRHPTSWPDGYVVRFTGGSFVVLDPTGAVVAREGQVYREDPKRRDLDPCWMADSARF